MVVPKCAWFIYEASISNGFSPPPRPVCLNGGDHKYAIDIYL